MKKTVSYLLMLALCVTTFSIYGQGYISPWTIALALGCLVIFFLCEFVNKYNRWGTILVCVYLFLISAGMLACMMPGFRESGIVFQEWMLTRGEEAYGDHYYLIALALGCVTFFGFTVYYFTIIRYRLNFLTLVSMMPCVLYAKVVAEVEDSYLAVIALLCVLAAVYHTGNNENTPKKSALIFAVITVLICALIPRKSEAVYYDRFEELFLLHGNKDEVAEADLSGLNEFSGNADGYQKVNARRLFMLKGDEPPYLKRHNFDYYDREKNYWYKDKQFEYMTASQSFGERPDERMDTIGLVQSLLTVEKLSPGFLKEYGLEAMADPEVMVTLNDDVGSLLIVPIDFKPEYFLGASRQTALTGAKKPENKYMISYYPDRLLGRGLCEKRAVDITLDKSKEMLSRACEILDDPAYDGGTEYKKAYETVCYFNDRTLEAIVYRDTVKKNDRSISDEVRAQAAQITGGSKYDWEKALELQKYFHAEDFTYDLEYNAPDDSVEYFLDKKIGTCSDFASAYVQMARASGLSVRYTEGFKTEESSRDNNFYIKETDSHAYPEVFVPLVGWCVFEPTVAAEVEQGFFEKLGINIKMDFKLVSTVVTLTLIIAVAGVFIKLILPLILDIGFAISLIFTPKKQRPVKRYRRLVNKLAKKKGRIVRSLTPRELLAWYEKEYPRRRSAQRSLGKLTQSVEEVLYK